MLLNEMEIFFHVVEQQSFSRAAEHLGVSKSFISKKISSLERALHTRLLVRNTRKLMLTEAGEQFYPYCAQIVQLEEKGCSLLEERQGKPSGTLKVSVPPAMGLHLLVPAFSAFLSKFPEVKLDIRLESHVVDLIKEGYDIAIRSAVLESSNLIAQKIYSVKNVICATGKYLENYPLLSCAEDLLKHNFAVYSGSSPLGKFYLSKRQHKEVIYVKGNLVSNQLDLIKTIILQNICLGVLPEFMVLDELKSKTLIACLPDYSLPTSNVYAIYPEKEFMPLKLKQFIEILKKSLI